MMQMHELIDREEPRCLYCHHDLQLKSSGERISKSPIILDVETLRCDNCQEVFEIWSMQNDDGATRQDAFTFTCKDLVVHHHYNRDHFIVGGTGLLYTDLISFTTAISDTVRLPVFEVDFSDKNQLHQKLRTYLLFS